MKVKSQESRVKSRTMCCAAICLAMALPAAIRAHAQCYIDPVTGERVCAQPPQSIPGGSAPALDSRLSALDSRAHCRINVGDGTAGSGTLIGVDTKIGLVLTCSHLFDGSTERIVVTFPNGGRYAARLVDRDRVHDLAALAIRPPHLEPIIVGDEQPAGTLVACGFGPNGQFRSIRGVVTGQATAVGAAYPSLTISGSVRPGDSGGGVLNTRGQLVGVVWGQRDGLTYASCGRPVREFLDRIRGSRAGASPPPDRPQFNWQAWSQEIDARLRALEDVPKINTDQFARRSEIDGKLNTLSTRFESVHARVESVRQHVEQVAASKGGFFQGLSFGKLVVGALGLSGPLAAAVIVAGGLTGRRWKRAPLRVAAKRLSATRSDSVGERAYHPIAVDSPPPPQRTVPETHYVPVEKDSFAKAHQWASEHVARKYPGATEILQAQDSLIKQYLAAT